MTDKQKDTVPAETDLIKVEIQNLNDSPEFLSDEAKEFEFPEITTENGAFVGDITSTGRDEDQTDKVSDGTLTYSLHLDDGTLSPDFEITWDPPLGTDSASRRARITVKRDTGMNPFDFEDDSDKEVRVCEERSDELSRRFYGILKSKADTFVRNVAAANSAANSNADNTTPFAPRFARRSGISSSGFKITKALCQPLPTLRRMSRLS